MIVYKYLKKGGVPVYAVSADVRETAEHHPRHIAEFDDLESAVIVMKYMRGDRMPEEDQKFAKEMLRRVQ